MVHNYWFTFFGYVAYRTFPISGNIKFKEYVIFQHLYASNRV